MAAKRSFRMRGARGARVQVRHRRNSFSSLWKSVSTAASTRRVWVCSRPSGMVMVMMMDAVMTSTFILAAP